MDITITIILMIISLLFIGLSMKSLLSGISDVEMQEYFEMYGSEQYGKTAYYLNEIRFCTMFVWIFGIWIGSYIKKKNFLLGKKIKVISIVLLMLSQLLPLLYAICIKLFLR